MKMFVSLKNSSMFAVSFAKRYVKNTLIVGAFFYANTVSADAENIQGYQTPFTDCYTTKYCDCLLAKTEGDSLSYFQLTNNFIRKMPKDNGITERVNNSNSIRTPRSATTAPIGFKTQNQVNQLSNSRGKLHKVTQLDEEPIVSNMYLETLCKAFREFVIEEANDICLSEKRFLEKIEAIRLLFPEDKKQLKHLIK